ncbi:MAG: type II toxin-antitoxin system VapC family toxin [Nanoarchaeota archaeon]|nr:type II toxin-antitoxin system VapC family toxin [DPANN group archaeon]MBL7116990.1 type II toxin-antitoxin system VapC family toxin [Nanoarchaeota archaeon]
MKQKYYLDTCIWRDYYENRSDKFRPLGEWALELLNLIIKNKDEILVSELVIKELGTEYSKGRIKDLFEINGVTILFIPTLQQQRFEAIKLSQKRKVHASDALHAVLARDNKAILVSRDNHFLELLDIVDVKKPEDLI